MSSAGRVQTCQLASFTEIKAQDQFANQYSDPINERVQAANHDYLSGMRESLFRLLSKVPIQIETVTPTSGPNGYATTSDQHNQQLAAGRACSSQQPAGAAQRQPSGYLRDPLVIKYYQEKSLSNIIELHFACSLMSDTRHHHHHHHNSGQLASKSLINATDCPNQYHDQLVSPNLSRPALNDVAANKSVARKPAARGSLRPHQRTTGDKSLQRDKFNGPTKSIGANGASPRSLKQAIQQRRAFKLQQRPVAPLHTTTSQMDAFNGGQVAGGGGGVGNHEGVVQSYRPAGSYDQPQHQSAILSDSVQLPSCATITYDEQTAPVRPQNQFVFAEPTGASGQMAQMPPQLAQIQLASPPLAACMLDSQGQHVVYAPAREPVLDQPQLDYNQQQQQYQHYSQFHTAPAPGEAQQQFSPYGGVLAQSEAHEYQSHTGHALHGCDGQHQAYHARQQQQQQQQSGRALAWHADQVHQYSEQFGASHQHLQCGGAQPSDHHQHSFIHFNVTDLNQMIEQRQELHESELHVVSKTQYFQKHQAGYGDQTTHLIDDNTNNMHRIQLVYHDPQPPEVRTTPLESSDGPAQTRQGSSLETNSSSSCSSSSSSSISSTSASSTNSRSAGPTTPLVDTNAPTHLDDCLHLEQINPTAIMGGPRNYT